MNATEFRQSVSRFDRDFGRVKDGEDRLLVAVKRFGRRLQELATTNLEAGISHRHEVAKLTDHLKSAIWEAIRQWSQQLADEAPVKKFSARYEDRAMLLVFGKVNCGKSTLVNFLVDELQRAGASVTGFALEAGEQIEVDAHFAVGATETTARIQGVEVDDRLVFMDSPGLLSVTDENHELTKMFTDSADAVLWVSPSSSPGQVQELRDLKAELERKKPLLPVITKSDARVEDWCDATGSITAETRNKTREVRKEQEDDVLSRTRQLGLKAEIRPVISISVFAYERAGRSDDARTESGLDNLYECLVGLVDGANSYKVGKAEQVARNYVVDILETTKACVEPALDSLIEQSDCTVRELDGAKRQQLKDEVETDALSQLRRIVDRHKDSKDKEAIADELRATVTAKLAEAIHREFTSYVDAVAGTVVPLLALSSNDLDDFEDISIDFEQTKGTAGRSVAASLGSAGATAGGAALGTVVFPGIGTAIGALLGGIAGSIAGDRAGRLFEHTDIVSENVGVSAEALEKSAHRAMKRSITNYVDSATDALIETIRSTTAFAGEVNSEIDWFKKEVGRIA